MLATNHPDGDGIVIGGKWHLNALECEKLRACRSMGEVVIVIMRALCCTMGEAREALNAIMESPSDIHNIQEPGA